jgi:hypothetical protein
MPYDAAKDPNSTDRAMPHGFSKKGRVVEPSNTVDLDPYARAIVVVAAGNLVYLPSKNDDEDTITVTDAPVGYTPPHQVRRVLATGTTATVVTVDD